MRQQTERKDSICVAKLNHRPGVGDGEAEARLAVAEGVEIAAAAILHHHAGVMGGSVEVSEESREEGVVEDTQNPLLRGRPLLLLLLLQLQLVDHLHGVRARRRYVAEAAEVDGPYVTAPDASDQFEVSGAEDSIPREGGSPRPNSRPRRVSPAVRFGG